MVAAGIKTQAELAKRLDASPGQVSGWIDASNVELTTLFRFAKALNVSVPTLVANLDAEYEAQRAQVDYATQLAELVPQLTPGEQHLLVTSVRMLLRLPPLPDAPPIPTAPPTPEPEVSAR